MIKLHKLLLLTILLTLPAAALAQQEFVEPFQRFNGPYCSDIINRSTVKIHGKVRTAQAKAKDGTVFRHEANFAISPGDKWQVCSEGPFYEGERVELQIVTFLPVFRCYTKLGTPIYLMAQRKRGEYIEGYDWSATCY